MIRQYKIAKHNSTVCGYPGRDFDWSKFCWDGSEINKAIFKGHKDDKAPLPGVDDGFIEPDCQYLHVPYDWLENGTIYRVRPNESMRAGEIYRRHLVLKQRAVKNEDGWYWELEQEDG